MTLLEDYLDNYENKELPSSIYTMHNDFGYNDEELYQIDLEFMLNNIYNIKIIETPVLEIRKKRINQSEFRKKIIERFNNKCIITGNDCIDELEACHIIPVATNEDYSIDNGLLLEKNIHCTVDKYLWSINPDTFQIESKNIGTIKKYQDMKLELFDDMIDNLRQHYNIYKSHN
jgi:predicted restriction endonuclease